MCGIVSNHTTGDFLQEKVSALVPLLDTRIADLVTSIPPNLKFQGGRQAFIKAGG